VITLWFVWSRGLEQWEEIRPSVLDVFELKQQHVKTVNGRELTVYLDPLARYVGRLQAPTPSFYLDEVRPTLDDEVALVAGMSANISREVDVEILLG